MDNWGSGMFDGLIVSVAIVGEIYDFHFGV